MKLEIARGLFLVCGLAVATAAIAAWEVPRAGVLIAPHGNGHCPLPKEAKAQSSVRPDKDFMLFMLGLSQGVKGQG